MKFATKVRLYLHKIKIHDKKFQCNYCLKTFGQNAGLVRHVRTHTGEKPYPCATCDRRFASKDDLRYHEASIHSDEGSFTCHLCQDKTKAIRARQVFKTKLQLARHMRLHCEPKYSCTKCDKKFRTSHQLTAHQVCKR